MQGEEGTLVHSPAMTRSRQERHQIPAFVLARSPCTLTESDEPKEETGGFPFNCQDEGRCMVKQADPTWGDSTVHNAATRPRKEASASRRWSFTAATLPHKYSGEFEIF